MKWIEISSDDCGNPGKRYWIVEIGAAQCINKWLLVSIVKAWIRFRVFRRIKK